MNGLKIIKWAIEGMNCIQKYLEGNGDIENWKLGKILGKCDRMKKVDSELLLRKLKISLHFTKSVCRLRRGRRF